MLTFEHIRPKQMIDDPHSRWAEMAKRTLKAELKMANVSYAELARRLNDVGLPETEGSVAVKINRGTYPAWFLFVTMQVIRVRAIRLPDREVDWRR